jgi:hypothetical protein
LVRELVLVLVETDAFVDVAVLVVMKVDAVEAVDPVVVVVVRYGIVVVEVDVPALE